MEFQGRLAIQQRVAPDYRRSFFDRLARACKGGMSVFAGSPLPGEGVVSAGDLGAAEWARARNIHIAPGEFYACWQWGITRWLAKADPDVLILEANPRELSNASALGWMRGRGRPVLLWGLGAAARRGPLAALRLAMRRAMWGGAAGAIAYSRRGKREFEQLGFPPERVFVAPNAVTPRPSPKPSESAPRNQDGALRILFVGRLQPRKRVDLLIEAAASQTAPVELIVAGDGPARVDLQALALSRRANATFLGDVRGAELEAVYERADLFVLPGTGGLAVQQALAHSLPVIVAQGDGTQEDMVTPVNGWRIADGDVASLREAIQEAAADRPKLAQKGRASWQLARDRFNLEAMTEVFVQAVTAVSKGF